MMPAQVKTEDFLLFETRGRVAYLTFNRPQQLNALSWPLMEALEQKLKQLERDPKVGVIVLRGAGRCFSSGYDLHETDPTKMIKGEGPADGTHEPKGVPEYGRSIWNSRAHVQGHINYDIAIWNLWKPVVAQVHGYALAGDSTLALACDLTIMADDAKIGYPPNRWLATGDNIGIYSFLAGLKIAREMSYGRCLTGVRAAQCGLATRSFPAEQLEEETYKIAAQIAEIDPQLLMLNKMVVNRMWEMMGIRAAMEVSGEFDSLCHMSDTGRELREAILRRDRLSEGLHEVNAPWGGI
jgi:enoyl-CoA hydratase/carnithine racemase